jgi:hypothetical protein
LSVRVGFAIAQAMASIKRWSVIEFEAYLLHGGLTDFCLLSVTDDDRSTEAGKV